MTAIGIVLISSIVLGTTDVIRLAEFTRMAVIRAVATKKRFTTGETEKSQSKRSEVLQAGVLRLGVLQDVDVRVALFEVGKRIQRVPTMSLGGRVADTLGCVSITFTA